MTQTHRTLVMGVLNVTPDSFSDGGAYFDESAAIARGEELVAQGADIIDVGGESTRPGAEQISSSAELDRVLAVVTALAGRGISVSVDTMHAATAEAVTKAGAHYINDVSGGLFDPAMLDVAARASRDHGASFIIGHWRGIPDPQHLRSDYSDVVTEVRDALAEQMRLAREAGVAEEHIILDPGLGFDKTAQQGWQLLAQLDALQALGAPVLVGASRKRMLKDALAESTIAPRQTSPAERDVATAVVSALSARAGAWGVRVHDVRSTVDALTVEAAWSGAAQGGAAR